MSLAVFFKFWLNPLLIFDKNITLLGVGVVNPHQLDPVLLGAPIRHPTDNPGLLVSDFGILLGLDDLQSFVFGRDSGVEMMLDELFVSF